MPKIYLYAEVLTHIRQLTLYASIETAKDEAPKIDISSDKKRITVVHEGESSTLYLPTQISGTANVTFMTEKKTDVSARVQIEDLEQWKDMNSNDIDAPWIASELTLDTVVRCKQCEDQILPPQRIVSWKDLPSQDWADVMDLWYCHKPHEEHDGQDQQQAAEAKGISAKSRLASHRGTGMVDTVSFVLHPDDCNSIKISGVDNENDVKSRPIHCTTCENLVGSFSPQENLVRLHKSRLSVKRKADEGFLSFPTATFVGAQLLSLIESSPIRKVVVHSSLSNHGSDERRSKRTENRAKRPESDLDQTAAYSEQTKGMPVGPGLSINFSDPKLEPDHKEETKGLPKDLEAEEVPLYVLPGEKGSVDGTTSETTTASSTNNPEPNEDGDTDPSTTSERPGLLLWIFNPDIYYSCSLHPSSISTAENPTGTAHRALKIFYTVLPSPLSYLDSTPQTSIEELHLPGQSDVDDLRTSLETSTAMLPHTVRQFKQKTGKDTEQQWDIGLLDRWERKGTAEDVLAENPLARKVVGDAGDGRVTRWELPEGYQELYM